MRMKEALSSKRAVAIHIEVNEARHSRYADFIHMQNVDADHVSTVDEAGAFWG